MLPREVNRFVSSLMRTAHSTDALGVGASGARVSIVASDVTRSGQNAAQVPTRPPHLKKWRVSNIVMGRSRRFVQ